MKEPQAHEIVARINGHYAGRIVASLDRQKAQPDGNGYRVELLLLAGQRRASINYPHQVDDILAAWQVFFSAHTEESEAFP
jgi:hypothetical protein